MAKPFIAAFKAGATSVDNYIQDDQLIYWYRPQPKSVNCDATDTCMQPLNNGDYYVGRPNGYQTVTDNVFVVSLLKSGGNLQVTSGGTNTELQRTSRSEFVLGPYGRRESKASRSPEIRKQSCRRLVSKTLSTAVSADCIISMPTVCGPLINSAASCH